MDPAELLPHELSHRRSRFLDLPWEVRDMIYTILLDQEASAPESEKALPKCNSLFPFWQHNVQKIHVPPPAAAVAACQGLLRCNKQVSSELLINLRRRKRQGQTVYKLDCMVVRGIELFPSWLRLSCPLRFLHTFQIDVRMVRSNDGNSKVSRSSNPTFKIIELVEEFFNRGSMFRPVNVRRMDVVAHTLVFNILPPPPTTRCLKNKIWMRPALKRGARLPDGSVHPYTIWDDLKKVPGCFQRNLRGKVKLVRLCYDRIQALEMEITDEPLLSDSDAWREAH